MKIMATIAMLSVTLFFPPQNKKEIKPLKGSAPYGVEKRPMPAGLNLDELLPKSDAGSSHNSHHLQREAR